MRVARVLVRDRPDRAEVTPDVPWSALGSSRRADSISQRWGLLPAGLDLAELGVADRPTTRSRRAVLVGAQLCSKLSSAGSVSIQRGKTPDDGGEAPQSALGASCWRNWIS